MGETIMVLLVFFIIIVIGLVFYGTYQAGQMREEIKEAIDKDAIQTALKVSFLPEVTCTENNVVEDNCFDIEKVKAFSFNINHPAGENMFLFYINELKKSKISVEKVFPKTRSGDDPNSFAAIGPETTVLYDNVPTEEERAENYQLIPTYIPITLKDPTKRVGKEYSFGILTVEVYKEG